MTKLTEMRARAVGVSVKVSHDMWMKAVRDFVDQGWLLLADATSYTLGARALAELKDVLQESFPKCTRCHNSLVIRAAGATMHTYCEEGTGQTLSGLRMPFNRLRGHPALAIVAADAELEVQMHAAATVGGKRRRADFEAGQATVADPAPRVDAPVGTRGAAAGGAVSAGGRELRASARAAASAYSAARSAGYR